MVNLIIDIGNSSLKAAFSEGIQIGEVETYRGDNPLEFIREFAAKERPDVISVSCVRNLPASFFGELEKLCRKLIVVTGESELPLKNLYKTPATLGADRICAAIAAADLFPQKDILIFDFGTAVTIDFISANKEFLGGNISPGLTTRFRALNQYTQQLPLLEAPDETEAAGTTTTGAIHSGVVLGLIFEIEGYIKHYPNHIHIFTGGDAIYFAKKLKSSIFVVYNLVLMGLARIADNYAKS